MWKLVKGNNSKNILTLGSEVSSPEVVNIVYHGQRTIGINVGYLNNMTVTYSLEMMEIFILVDFEQLNRDKMELQFLNPKKF